MDRKRLFYIFILMFFIILACVFIGLTGSTMGIIIASLCAGLSVLLIISYIAYSLTHDNKKHVDETKEETALKILEKYRSITTVSLGESTDADKLWIVAKNFGAKNKKEALYLYNLAIEIENEKTVVPLRNEESKKYSAQKSLAERMGREKYSGIDKNYITSRLIDDENIEDKFGKLNITDVKYTFTDGNNFLAEGKIQCNDSFTIADQPAILDGSLLIEIKNEKNKTVAEGYIYAPHPVDDDLRTAGFHGEMKFKSLCKVPDKTYKTLDKSKDYTYEIKPISMWIIEV